MGDFIPDSDEVLYLDIGNSTIKAAFRRGVEWKQPEKGHAQNVVHLLDWIINRRPRFQFIVISSVVPGITQTLTEQLEKDRVRVLSVDDFPADMFSYDTPETLGIDRFMVCYGAVSQTQKPVVVIDAGTACTVDYMSADSVFHGGVIIPGIGIMEKSLKEQVPNLPVVQRSVPNQWPGKSTKESLQWGLVGMVQNSLSAYLDKYASVFGDYELFLTGGNAQWIDSILDRPGKVRPMLIFDGMHSYLKTHL